MGIDLNAVEEDAAAVTSGELWHACAGAGVALPRRGSKVVYLPQAHLVAGGGEEAPPVGAGAVPVPPHVVCLVVGVDLCVSLPGRLAGVSSFTLLLLLALWSEKMKFCCCAGGRGDGRGVRAARTGGGRRGQCCCYNLFCGHLLAL
jgi:hypothetical protein